MMGRLWVEEAAAVRLPRKKEAAEVAEQPARSSAEVVAVYWPPELLESVSAC